MLKMTATKNKNKIGKIRIQKSALWLLIGVVCCDRCDSNFQIVYILLHTRSFISRLNSIRFLPIILLLQDPFYVTYNCHHNSCLRLARLVLTLSTRRANHKHQSTEHSWQTLAIISFTLSEFYYFSNLPFLPTN